MVFGEIFWITVSYSFIMAFVFKFFLFPRIMLHLSKTAVEDTDHEIEGEKRFYLSRDKIGFKDISLILGSVAISGPFVWIRLLQMAVISKA